jgi:hypothetical protein
MHSINAAQKAAAMPPASTGAQKAKRAQSLAVGPEGERLRTHMLTAACLRRRIGDPNLGHESISMDFFLSTPTQTVTFGPFASGRWRCPKMMDGVVLICGRPGAVD